eukprot:6332769-Heterocapsa_arctica.AAC.1
MVCKRISSIVHNSVDFGYLVRPFSFAGRHPFDIGDSPQVHKSGLFPSLPKIRMLPPVGSTATLEDTVDLVYHSQAVRDNGDVSSEPLRH